MKPKSKPRLLCVDDEPHVLDGLALTLGRRFDVHTASSGAEGLEILSRVRDISIVISDMRMPEMNGAEFLSQASASFPDSIRMLLTGESDLQSAIKAVNDGQIFRFLQKPCAPDDLLNACHAALRQHQLVAAERSVLDETLRGAVAALTDLLCLVDPVAFGKTMWVRQYVADLCTDLAVPNRWQLDVAAMVSQLGSVTLGKETATKVRRGDPLTDLEQAEVDALPGVVAGLLAGIPRLEPVQAILGEVQRWNRAGGASRDSDAQILRVAIDFDALHSTGLSSSDAVAQMGARELYDPQVLQALAARRKSEEQLTPRELSSLSI